MYKRIAILGSLLVLVLLTSLSAAQAQTRQERAEVRFLEGMIDHHQMALDMANDCLAKAVTPSVRAVCQNIISAQTREILTMRGWLLAWYAIDYQPMSMLHLAHQETPPSAGMGMMDGGGGMGMMDMMGNEGGMGMMGGGGRGTGGDPGMMDTTSMHHVFQIYSIMGSLTIDQLLQDTGELDPNTSLLDVFQFLIDSGRFPFDITGEMSGINDLTFGQMRGMYGEMGNLTLTDVREMMEHLDQGGTATMLTMMTHHMDVMAGGQNGLSSDHESHHPEVTVTPAGTGDHAAHGGNTGSGAGTTIVPKVTLPLQDPSMTMGMFAGLNYLTGTEYEVAWLESMIDHHDDAIHMAERVLPRAVHPELSELAQQIITDQTGEIEQMETLIVEIGG